MEMETLLKLELNEKELGTIYNWMWAEVDAGEEPWDSKDPVVRALTCKIKDTFESYVKLKYYNN